jgi:hypothetical protein
MSKARFSALLAVVAVLVAAGTSGAFAARSAKPVPPCPPEQLGQPFLPWLDPGMYFLAPGGGFENGLSGWSATGGASIVAGNEPFFVGSPNDSHSLALPPGSSVTSPLVCVSLFSPDLRFFTRNTGSALSTLRVAVNYTNLLGQPATSPVGLLVAGQKWAPTLPLLFLQNTLVQSGVNGQTWVSFTLTPLGSAGKWQVDDFEVDPLKNH